MTNRAMRTTVDGEAVEAVGQVAASASRDRKRDLEALGYLEEVEP